MPSGIILIGSIGTGKSTIGRLLATKLNLPQWSMDEKRWDYYKEMGYDEELAQHKRETEGFWGIYQYWKPFEVLLPQKCWNDDMDNNISSNVSQHSNQKPALPVEPPENETNNAVLK
jgi:hypothetical protein